MNAKVLIVLVFLAAVAAIVAATVLRGRGDAPATPGAAPTSTAPSTTVSMLYSSEKQTWVESAAEGFRKEHPEIALDLKTKGSFDAMQAILDGKEKPTIFSPADSLVMGMLQSDWETRGGSPLVAHDGADAPKPLVITPLVFVAWEERAKILETHGSGAIKWDSLQTAVADDRGWAAVGGPKDWGFVKLGLTDPTRSNSGLQGLVLATMDHLGRTNLSVGDATDTALQGWVKGIAKGVGKAETSSRTLIENMIRFGPSRVDVAVTYESLAVDQLKNAQGRWGNLPIYYPSITLWSDNPAALLQGDWVTPEQAAAGRLWLDYLLSRPVQSAALQRGFRPADPSVPLRGEADNPLVANEAYGVKLDIGSAAAPPAPEVCRGLMTMWSRVQMQ